MKNVLTALLKSKPAISWKMPTAGTPHARANIMYLMLAGMIQCNIHHSGYIHYGILQYIPFLSGMSDTYKYSFQVLFPTLRATASTFSFNVRLLITKKQ